MTSSIPKNPETSIPYTQHRKQEVESFSTIDNKSRLYQTYDKAILTSLKSRLLGIPKQLNLFPVISTIKFITISGDTNLDISQLAGSYVILDIITTNPTITITYNNAETLGTCNKLEDGAHFSIYINTNNTVTIDTGSITQTFALTSPIVGFYNHATTATLTQSG